MDFRSLCKSGASYLTSTILMGPLRLLVELRPLFGAGDGGVVVVQTLRHPLADDVHQPLEGLLHINVVFSARFKELETCQDRTGEGKKKEGVFIAQVKAHATNPLIL